MKYKIEKIETYDDYAFSLHLRGPEYYSAIDEIMNSLRHKVKYSDEMGSWEEAYEMVIQILNERNIDTWDGPGGDDARRRLDAMMMQTPKIQFECPQEGCGEKSDCSLATRAEMTGNIVLIWTKCTLCAKNVRLKIELKGTSC